MFVFSTSVQAETLVLRPDELQAKDAWIGSSQPDLNHDNSDLLTASAGLTHGLIEFDLSDLHGVFITSATLDIL